MAYSSERDTSNVPIIAIDFDETICIGSSLGKCSIYPEISEEECHIRPYADKVLRFLHALGVKIIINTCRDGEIDIAPIKKYHEKHNIPYDTINQQIAVYTYDARKIYAHMYVDDKAFGWNNSTLIMLSVLLEFLIHICKFSTDTASNALLLCVDDKPPTSAMKEIIINWNTERRN